MCVDRPKRIEGAVFCRVDLARTRPCFHEADLCARVCVCV